MRPANQISSLWPHQVANSGCRVVWWVTRAGHRLVFNPTTGRVEQRKAALLLTASPQKILISPICSTPTFGWKPRLTFQIRLFNRLSYDRVYDTPPQAFFSVSIIIHYITLYKNKESIVLLAVTHSRGDSLLPFLSFLSVSLCHLRVTRLCLVFIDCGKSSPSCQDLLTATPTSVWWCVLAVTQQEPVSSKKLQPSPVRKNSRSSLSAVTSLCLEVLEEASSDGRPACVELLSNWGLNLPSWGLEFFRGVCATPWTSCLERLNPWKGQQVLLI